MINKLCLTLLITLSSFSIAHAQMNQGGAPEDNIGFRGGVNFANYSGADAESPDARTTFQVGIFGNFHVNNDLYLQPELNYSNKGATVSESSVTYTEKLSYLEIPIILQYKSSGLSFGAGPYIALLMGAEAELSDGSDSNSTDLSEYIQDGGYGLAIDANVELSSDFPLMVGARYNLGLSTIVDTGTGTNPEIKNGVFNIYAAFSL